LILPTRWMKILKDTWSNRTRSLLVVFSIAVGVAAVGMINHAGIIVRRDLFGSYASGNPASLHITVSPFQEGLARAVAAMPEVRAAQARRVAGASLLTSAGEWVDLNLNAFPDMTSIAVDQVRIQSGRPALNAREIVIERQSAAALNLNVGDTLRVKTDGERTYDLTIVGIAHDLYTMPYALLGQADGYVTLDTLVWMGMARSYNRLDVVVQDNPYDRDHVIAVGDQIRDQVIVPSGHRVLRSQIPGLGADPGKHWAQDQINGFLLILQIMGAMAILLSSGLVVNTVSAILVQQTKQIGIMRAMGADRRQLIGMYSFNVFVFCVLGLLIAIPLGVLGGWWLAKFAAGFINFDISSLDIPIQVLLLEIAVGLVMPLGVALYPIIRGTRMTIYDAVYQNGLAADVDQGPIERGLMRLRGRGALAILALRNTFRNKTRLAFTLITLTLAGAMFIAVFSTRASLNEHLDETARYVDFDVLLPLKSGSDIHTVLREARRIPGLAVTDAWAQGLGVIVRGDGSETEQLDILGLEYNSGTIDPWMLQGHWLQPGDTRGVVVNNDLLESEPGLGLGDTIRIKAGDRTLSYQIVGVTSNHLSGPRIYMDFRAFGTLMNRPNQVDTLRVRVNPDRISSKAVQDSVAAQVETRFDNAGLKGGDAVTNQDIFGDFTDVFDLILTVLVVMAILLAIVGGLGLTGSLGINVLERTREIGVLRAVGASNLAVRKVVLIEGMCVGLISWILGALLSGPVGRGLSAAVIQAVMQSNLGFRYSFVGLFLWLLVVGLIGVGASLAPARRAARLTVREVLDYE
jgi:putative ABC transport system permease protein